MYGCKLATNCKISSKYILSLSENIAKSFRGRATFLTHTVIYVIALVINRLTGLKCSVLTKLSDIMGPELWDLCHSGIERICKAWRMRVRRVWGLPYDCRTCILQIMSDTLAMYDVICKRSLMFIKRCLYAESDVVRFIAQNGVLYGGMASGIGRNVLTYSRHYRLPACLLYTSPSPRDRQKSRMPSSA